MFFTSRKSKSIVLISYVILLIFIRQVLYRAYPHMQSLFSNCTTVLTLLLIANYAKKDNDQLLLSQKTTVILVGILAALILVPVLIFWIIR